MQFLARAVELDSIARLGASSAGGALVFTGEHGIGKTRLMTEALARSSLRAVLVQTNPAESAWPLSGFTAVFASIDDPRAVEFAGRFTLRSTEPQQVFAAARDLLTMLRGLGLPPLLVLIDDLDRMDEISQTLIGFMAGRLAGTGLRVVATAQRLARDHMLAFRESPLAPLSFAEAAELVQGELGPSADAGTVQILAARSGGNPLVVEQSAHALTPDQIAGREALVLPMRPPRAMKAVSAVRVATLSPAARAVAEDVAMAPLSDVGRLTGDDVERIDALEELLYSGFVDVHGQVVRMHDPLLRSYHYWSLEPHHRRDRHRELAALGDGPRDRTRAWHESFAPAGRTVVAELLEAASALTEADESDAAVEFAERALLIDPDLTTDHEGMHRFASALAAQGLLDLASRYLARVHVGTPTAAENLRLATTRIGIELSRSHVVPTDDVEASVSLYGDDDPLGAAVLLSMVSSFHSGRWDLEEARRWLLLAGLFVEKAGETPAGYTDAARMIDAVDGRSSVSPVAARLSSDDLQELSVWSLTAFATVLCYQERYAQARRVVNVVFHDHPTAHLARSWAWSLSLINEIRAGDFRRAHAVVEYWNAEPTDSERDHAGRALAMTWHALTLGLRDEANERAEECTSRGSAERNPAVLARLSTFLGTDALLRRDLDEAVRLFTLADAGSAHIDNLSLVRHADGLVEALTLSGRPAEAEAVLQRMLVQQRERPSTWLDLAVARSRAVLAPDEAAPALFDAAVALHEEHAGDYDLGRALIAQGDRLSRLGLRGASETVLATAAAAFERAGASQWARRASAGEPVVVRDADSIMTLLKAEERVIAELVRRGLRNREIAGELFISLRTVELRLTHIYRKVGARSRSHLASLLN
ncbi:helix-turn-helix transcriptional regulator [Herbiconiux flava]|uniref:DNA-binding CsgD family transcriptional regulator n=1 Tax=Herbiconiux flava TaxID=881268 RepID=A0A852SQZ4_9MICO|nr:LuxR family transcriptional regulator [Herbiconiux flava]NYD71195.1 DNA-binding CsgD family transcriptional regulator [Herbiconiux flava]GLK18841.1 transcriptional regulator [Herbiconiux flava]